MTDGHGANEAETFIHVGDAVQAALDTLAERRSLRVVIDELYASDPRKLVVSELEDGIAHLVNLRRIAIDAVQSVEA